MPEYAVLNRKAATFIGWLPGARYRPPDMALPKNYMKALLEVSKRLGVQIRLVPGADPACSLSCFDWTSYEPTLGAAVVDALAALYDREHGFT